jgi:RNA polymerase sigma factor (sigma-70 family)
VAEEHLDDVYRFLVYLTKDVHTAEDLTSETFTKALSSWSRFDERRGSARTWLCQIARSAALDHFRAEERRRKREQSYAAHAPLSDDRDPFAGLSPPLRKALRELSAGDREVIALASSSSSTARRQHGCWESGARPVRCGSAVR